jgi:hypothetical protein
MTDRVFANIEVTQHDIDRAKVNDSSRCVVATAVARSIPGASRISVDVQTIRFTLSGERFVYLTPPAVTGYVIAFDAGEEIHPFRFRLRQDQELRVRRQTATEPGKAKKKARNEVAAARRKAEQAEQAAASPEASAADKRAAREARRALADTEAERAAVMAAYAGQPAYETDDPALPPPTMRMHKARQRHYGHREMRINQARDGD